MFSRFFHKKASLGRRAPQARASGSWSRFRVFRAGLGLIAVVLLVRLAVLQLWNHSFYDALASGQHDVFAQLFPERGDILLKDRFEEKYYPVATNQTLALIYADTRLVTDPQAAAEALAPVLAVPVEELLGRLSKKDDPFEPLLHFASDAVVDQVRALGIAGIAMSGERNRVYPEASIGGHLLGFLGWDAAGEQKGRYGIEGRFETELAGKPGMIKAERDVAGRFIPIADRTFTPAEDGTSIVLTIDRTVQFMACKKIREAVARHGASGGQIIVIHPKTGAVIAMCSAPDYDPNKYGEVADVRLFSNPAVSAAWEPGSIMKAVTMASAIDAGVVSPNTTYTDEGSLKFGPYTIKNSDGKAHGVVDMTTVLDESLNTGAVFAQQQMGADPFREYVKAFGLGQATGIELSGEETGDMSQLEKPGQIYAATTAFGQGMLATPLQMVRAFAVLANGGLMPSPSIVAEMRKPDGSVVVTAPKPAVRVITERAATLVSGMLVSVVENGHGKRAGVAGYRVAGKTGTAQIPRKDGLGYEADQTIGSFAGYAPVNDPKFVMLVRIDRPQDVRYAESTAAPVFGEMAAFLLQYYGVAPQ